MIFTQKFNTILEANYWCKGAISGGAHPAGNFVGLVGTTVTFATPAGSCTFTQPAGTTAGFMRFADVKAQLETAITNLKVECADRKIFFYHSNGTTPCALAAINETGRVPLGLPNNEAISGTILNAPGGAVPALVSVIPENGAIYITQTK
jgi:hypothetical protein